MESNQLDQIRRRIAQNVLKFRKVHGWTQEELARRAGLARSNVTYVESGEGNPSLEILAQIAHAFNVSIEELMRASLRQFRVYKSKDLTKQKRNDGSIIKLIPDEINGFEVDHVLLKAHGQMVGAPHMKGTLEYFYCLKGKIAIRVEYQEHSLLEQGDLLIFSGDQKHTYINYSSTQSEGISLIVLPQKWR